MQLRVTSMKDNPHLFRKEIYFIVEHPNHKTPKRSEIRDLVATEAKAGKDLTLLEYLRPHFGRAESEGFATVYENTEQAVKIARDHILKRNNVQGSKKRPKKGA